MLCGVLIGGREGSKGLAELLAACADGDDEEVESAIAERRRVDSD